MSVSGPETILLDLFMTNQLRERLIAEALAGTDMPPEDYSLYVLVGAEGPWTPTALAARMNMPLSTVLFRVKRLERRGHAERFRNPEDGRSFLLRLTAEGHRLLAARGRASAHTPIPSRLGSAAPGGRPPRRARGVARCNRNGGRPPPLAGPRATPAELRDATVTCSCARPWVGGG
jgi:DNA-binding MarR family transcriptional regulator